MNPFFEIAISNHQRGHKNVAASAYWGGMRNDHDDIGGLLGLSQFLNAEGNLDAADVLLERVERLLGRPHQHVDLGRGIIAAKQGRYADAEIRMRKIVSDIPDGAAPDAWLYLGVIRQNAGATDEAIDCFRKAEEAGSPLAKICRALALLEKGNFAEAIDLYDARWETGVVRPPVALHIRPWKGQPLEGKHIVVYEEQGFGDTIQMFRFIPELEARCARVTVLVRREMQRLLQAAWPGLVDLIECSMPEADYSLPMFDLLRFSGEFNGKPYLAADDDAFGPIVPHPGNCKKAIGIVWAGDKRHSNDRNRSVPLTQMARLAGIPGVALYSFQMGARAQELETAGFGAFIEDVAPNIRDFADTAALLKALDLVVSVDTAIVHLCGALGVPCFALIPYERDWRWGPSGETTAWYDSVRLFRQQTTGEWKPVMDDVLKAVSTTLNIDVQTTKLN